MTTPASAVLLQRWEPETVVLSYIIAVTGSFCTIQIMEQWRMQESGCHKRLLLWLASIALGGCGIWATHFTGMQALHIYSADGSEIDVDFELGLTIVSLLFPIAGVFVGLRVSSRDPFFLELEHSRRKAIVADQIRTLSIVDMLKKDSIQRRIKFIALFSRLWRILFGSMWAALGVLGMHYLGMMAQHAPLTMRLDGGVIAASCAIAFVTATAAFWIIFRALTFWPSVDALRIGSALVMGIAVCGTHYAGMAAAQYEYDASVTKETNAGLIVDGEGSFRVASYTSLVLCFWMVSLSVVRDLRVSVESAQAHSHPNTNASASNRVSESTPVLPYRNLHSIPRNVIAPGVDASSASGHLVKNTVVARLANLQQGVGLQHGEETHDLEQGWGVVPGRT